MRELRKLVLLILICLMTVYSYGQRSKAMNIKKSAFREDAQLGRLSLGGGYGFHANGNTFLANIEYLAHYHVKVDVSVFHRIEEFNELTMLRTGVMAGLKNTITEYFTGDSYLNLGAGLSLFNQNPVDFETETEFQSVVMGFYLSAEGLLPVSKRLEFVVRYDQHFAPSEKSIETGEILDFNQIGLMVRYKLKI